MDASNSQVIQQVHQKDQSNFTDTGWILNISIFKFWILTEERIIFAGTNKAIKKAEHSNTRCSFLNEMEGEACSVLC